MKKIKTIDVHAKEWFDRVNGNSYFSARVTINYAMPDEETLYIPFQYGYGDHYRDIAMKYLQNAGHIEASYMSRLWRYCDENKIIDRYSKEEKCLQRDVKTYGINYAPIN
jgi:hypothetical protein